MQGYSRGHVPHLLFTMLYWRLVRLGCITASHNPVSDSGIKVFDRGFKTSPDMEFEYQS